MDEEVKKVLLQREAEVDKAFEDYRFQRNLLDNYWDDIDHKRNWIIRTREEIQSAESSIRSSEEIFGKLKTEIELHEYYLEKKRNSLLRKKTILTSFRCRKKMSNILIVCLFVEVILR
ncbi:unnamed protein product [Lactuca saligna]|uniref:Uncharacterized protein n=1 Tax=Lactuca saligna TaxID=75948 RepID=A0AA35Z2S7_LACSI|nr:unnamed protein product [Lactuca saligna]